MNEFTAGEDDNCWMVAPLKIGQSGGGVVALKRNAIHYSHSSLLSRYARSLFSRHRFSCYHDDLLTTISFFKISSWS